MEYVFVEDIFFDKAVEEDLHGLVRKRSKFIVIQLCLGQQIEELKGDFWLQFAMMDKDEYELHVEDVEEV